MKLTPLTLGLLLSSSSVFAASGSWSDSKQGITVQNRGQLMAAPMLTPPQNSPVLQNPSAMVDSVVWSYSLLGPQPAGLEVQLCSDNNRCQQLDSASGQSRNFFGQSAHTSFRLLFGVQGKGRLNPPLTVVGQQIIVNYR